MSWTQGRMSQGHLRHTQICLTQQQGQSEAEAAPAGAKSWHSGAASAPLVNAGGSAAGAANAEALAASPVLPSGQPASPASSSDLRLEAFLGAAPAMHSAPAHVAGSSRGRPDGRAPGAAAASRHVAPVRETAAASADSSAQAQPAGPAPAAAAGAGAACQGGGGCGN